MLSSSNSSVRSFTRNETSRHKHLTSWSQKRTSSSSLLPWLRVKVSPWGRDWPSYHKIFCPVQYYFACLLILPMMKHAFREKTNILFFEHSFLLSWSTAVDASNWRKSSYFFWYVTSCRRLWGFLIYVNSLHVRVPHAQEQDPDSTMWHERSNVTWLDLPPDVKRFRESTKHIDT